MRILYIDIDSLRSDHLGCYGYRRPTSPNIDSIAQQGVQFNDYYASDSPCVPSRAACFSGRPGIQNGVVTHEDTPVGCTMRYGNSQRNGYAPLFMHQLIAAGYSTVSFSSFANRHLAGWFHFGFKQFNLSSLKNGHENSDEVNAVALPWFEANAKEDDWFVHLNYWDPHTLYTEPLSYMQQMAEYAAPEWPDEETIREQQSLTGVRTPRTLWTAYGVENGEKSPVATMPDSISNRADFEHLINGYDGAIRYLDDQLGRVFGELERQGVLDEVAIIISADHGEAFGELGQYMEHGTASPATNRIPLIVKWPGITDNTAGERRTELLYNMDLAPTVCEALGLEVAPGWQGQSFLPLLEGGSLSEERSHLVWSHGVHSRQRAVYDGRFLYIRTYHPSFFLYSPRMLFDLSVDPNQTNDLASQHPAQAELMDEILKEWEVENVKATGQPDPMRIVQDQPPSLLSPQEKYIERLNNESREDDAHRIHDLWESVDEDYAPPPL